MRGRLIRLCRTAAVKRKVRADPDYDGSSMTSPMITVTGVSSASGAAMVALVAFAARQHAQSE